MGRVNYGLSPSYLTYLRSPSYIRVQVILESKLESKLSRV